MHCKYWIYVKEIFIYNEKAASIFKFECEGLSVFSDWKSRLALLLAVSKLENTAVRI